MFSNGVGAGLLQLLRTGRSTFSGPTTLKTCFGDYVSSEMKIGQLPAGLLGGSTLGVCGRQTCPVTCPMLSEMLSVFVGSRKPLGFHYPCSHLSLRLLDRDLQQISQADTAEQFGTNPIHDHVGYLCSILCRIDMHPEWTLPEWRVYDFHNRIGDC